MPAGEFLMGSALTDTQAYTDEMPLHKVSLDEYAIGRYDVTNAQFNAFVQATRYKTTAEQEGNGYAYTGKEWKNVTGATWQHPRGPGSDIQGRDNYPVVVVSSDDAVAFCKWASQATGGRDVRLPTEAEWEKAARGTDGRIFPWGNSEPDANSLNYNMKTAGDISAVGKYSPAGDSPYGAADMSGNVWQWTSSLYKPYPYDAHDGREDTSSRDPRVLRGGAFYLDRMYARTAARGWNSPDLRADGHGFRVVVGLALVP